MNYAESSSAGERAVADPSAPVAMQRRQVLKLGVYAAAAAALDSVTAGCASAATGKVAVPATVTAAAGGKSKNPGLTSEGIQKITQVFNQLIAEDYHPGAQLAVYRDGKLALDLYGGVVESGGTAVTASTLYQIRSTTKVLTTMVTMQAYERGRFKFDDPVAKHWPEFAANGKGKITIAQVMSHRAGIPDGPMLTPEQLGDREAVAKAVAAMTPVWEPGSKNGYHASTIGWVCDELLQRWEGKAVAELVRRDFLMPLGLKDLFVGLPREQYPRMAKMDVHPDVRKAQELRARFSDFMNTPQGIGLPLAWAAGVSTARDLGRFMCILAHEGQFEGRTFFKPQTQALMSRPTNAPDEVDQRLLTPMRWGLGFMLFDMPKMQGAEPNSRVIGHTGGNACTAWADPDQRLAAAFLCNRMQSGTVLRERDRRVAEAIYAALV